MAKTRKVGASGRFSVRYGKSVREKITNIEKKQRKKQKCPYCKKNTLKRLSKGIWKCRNCEKKFASNTFYIE